MATDRRVRTAQPYADLFGDPFPQPADPAESAFPVDLKRLNPGTDAGFREDGSRFHLTPAQDPSGPVPLALFATSPPQRKKPRKGPGDPALRPLVLAMAAAYERKYGVPLLIVWGREMKHAKRALTVFAPVAGTLSTDPAALLLEAYDHFLTATDLSYQRVRHDTRLFWRDITRFIGEAADRRRGIQALPAHQRPAYPMPSHRPGWMSNGRAK